MSRALLLFCAQLRGIVVAGGGDGSSPTALRAFINRNDVDFGLASQLAPTQEWSLVDDATASLEYATRYAKFQSVSSVTLHFPSNGGAPSTRIHFIGLRGEARGARGTFSLPHKLQFTHTAAACAGQQRIAGRTAQRGVRVTTAAARPSSAGHARAVAHATMTSGRSCDIKQLLRTARIASGNRWRLRCLSNALLLYSASDALDGQDEQYVNRSTASCNPEERFNLRAHARARDNDETLRAHAHAPLGATHPEDTSLRDERYCWRKRHGAGRRCELHERLHATSRRHVARQQRDAVGKACMAWQVG